LTLCILISNGSVLETFSNGTPFGTGSGSGTANGMGSATTTTGPAAESITGAYTGSLATVPEPAAAMLLGITVFDTLMRRNRKSLAE
jgi:hypothetical protein